MAQFQWHSSFFGQNLSGRRWTAYTILLAVTISLYVPTLYFGFVWDDTAYIRTNFWIWSLDWVHLRAIWSNTYLGHYAPIHHTFLALIYRFFELNPLGYHLGQVLIHSACVVLLFALMKKVESPRVALLACLLFAVHPTNVETVAWISESKSTLGLFFILLSFLFFIKFSEYKNGYILAINAIYIVL
jgi:protein O-mannosyl-transferase